MRTMALPGAAAMTLVTIVLFPAAGRPAEEESPAVAAARARQDLVKTLDVTFKVTEVIPKGSISDANPEAYGKRAPVPANEWTAVAISHMVIDGEMVYYENNYPNWSNLYALNGGLSIQSMISVSDGSIVKAFIPSGMRGSGHSEGLIRKDRQGVWMQAYLMPITMTFHGSKPALFHPLVTGMKPTGNILPIDWTPCQEHMMSLNASKDERVWVDPEKDYVIRRYTGVFGEGLADIRYRRDDAWGWVPESWIHHEVGRNSVLRKTHFVNVLEMRINEPQPAELFDISFPPGCEVHDDRTMPYKVYRVLPDGSMREISERTGEFLTEPKVQPEGAWYWRFRWLLAGTGVILAGLAWQYAVRRKRANAA
jgi:hypothetical protein